MADLFDRVYSKAIRFCYSRAIHFCVVIHFGMSDLTSGSQNFEVVSKVFSMFLIFVNVNSFLTSLCKYVSLIKEIRLKFCRVQLIMLFIPSFMSDLGEAVAIPR